MRSDSDSVVYANRQKFVRKWLKIAALLVIVVVVFSFGVGVGNGTIIFGTPNRNTNKEISADLDYTEVEQLYDLLKANYDGTLDGAKLEDGLKHGLAKATGDPYTQYLDAKEAKSLNEQLSGSFTGIGAELGKDGEDNLIIVSPIADFPASKAGIRPKDIIVSIDGKSTADMSIEEAVSKIRGPKDTKVTLRLLRNKSEDVTVTITRADITIPSVKWEVLDGDIGYIQVSQFGEDTTRLMSNAADELKAKGVTRILLDLRGNPGGLLQTAVDMGGMWLSFGKTILQEKRGGVTTETYTSNISDPIFKDLPTVVLVNAGSASASEIVAGALRDNGAATVYGEKSYGKGSVQEIRKLSGGGELKMTIARWYRPNGQNIDKKGIKPDKEIKMTDEDFAQEKDPQKDAALEFLRSR